MRPSLRDQFRVARRPRMIGLLVVFLLAAAVFGRLGAWQLDRAVQRGEAAAAAEAAVAQQTQPVPIADVLAPQTTFTSDLVGRHVTVVGEFGDPQLVVPGRLHEGRDGALVLNSLSVPPDQNGGSEAALLAVVRGWVDGPADAAASSPPPSGPVQITGWLQVGEAAGDGALADGQIDAISPAELVNLWGGPMYTGYLVVESMDPAPDPRIALLDPPGVDSGGLNWQNLAYALQWWLFGLFAIWLWWRIVRDATDDVVADAAKLARDDSSARRTSG